MVKTFQDWEIRREESNPKISGLTFNDQSKDVGFK